MPAANQEKKAGGEAFYVYLFAVILVYLVLAAQYESLTSPAAVIFVVPLALLGAVVAVAVRGMDVGVAQAARLDLHAHLSRKELRH